MVAVARKKQGLNTYIYLQDVVHVAYLGREDLISKREIDVAKKFYSDPKNRGKKWKNVKQKLLA